MRGKLSVSIDDAAAMTGISRSNLYERIAAGQLPFVQLGARRLVRVADLLALLAAHRSGPVA